MKGTYKYAVLTMLLVLSFVFTSMKGMNFILQEKEKKLLTESGQAKIEIPVKAWEETGEENRESNGEKESAERGGYRLTVRQMEDSVKNWNEKVEEIFHEPVAGQISMEEAIGRGEDWLEEMGFKEGEEKEASLHAVLGVGRGQQEKQTEPYYSFWTVWFSDEQTEAVLYVNAVAGSVWGAEITFYGNQDEKTADDGLKKFADLAGAEAGNGMEADRGKTKRILAVKNSRLYAQEDRYSTTFLGKGDKLISCSKVIYRFMAE